jgi:hypothetical protein
LLGWDDVSLSGATTAVAASDRCVIPATSTAETITLFNATLASAAGRDYQTVSVTVAMFLHLLTGQVPAKWGRPARRASLLCCADCREEFVFRPPPPGPAPRGVCTGPRNKKSKQKQRRFFLLFVG